jgi:hypothetical protein
MKRDLRPALETELAEFKAHSPRRIGHFYCTAAQNNHVKESLRK